jgi:hypothetical protein
MKLRCPFCLFTSVAYSQSMQAGRTAFIIGSDVVTYSCTLLGTRSYFARIRTLMFVCGEVKCSSSSLGATIRACFVSLTSSIARVSPACVTGMASSVFVHLPRPRFSCAKRCSCNVDSAFHSACAYASLVNESHGYLRRRLTMFSRKVAMSIVKPPTMRIRARDHALNE